MSRFLFFIFLAFNFGCIGKMTHPYCHQDNKITFDQVVGHYMIKDQEDEFRVSKDSEKKGEYILLPSGFKFRTCLVDNVLHIEGTESKDDGEPQEFFAILSFDESSEVLSLLSFNIDKLKESLHKYSQLDGNYLLFNENLALQEVKELLDHQKIELVKISREKM
jgi:hypothetical protein